MYTVDCTRSCADSISFSEEGTETASYERNTWPELAHLAQKLPEAGVHFQTTELYRRTKDVRTPVGDWTAHLMSEKAWFRDLLPDVGHHYLFLSDFR